MTAFKNLPKTQSKHSHQNQDSESYISTNSLDNGATQDQLKKPSNLKI